LTTHTPLPPFPPSLSLWLQLTLPAAKKGALYNFARATPATRARSGLTIPNSIGFSPDGRTMYFTHSTAREVLAWDYDATSGGSLSNERVFYRHDGPGEPDGFRVDTAGNLWQAVYGESRVLKISPEGRLIGQINIPTRNPTCCELVGGGELVITTADDAEGEGESKRLGGAVFRVAVGAEGTKRFAFKL
jgi:sugar lactone lactonase YvrE